MPKQLSASALHSAASSLAGGGIERKTNMTKQEKEMLLAQLEYELDEVRDRGFGFTVAELEGRISCLKEELTK